MKQKLYILILFFSINYVNGQSPATHLNFDGVNDYVSIPSGIYVSNSSFTVEFMAKRTATNVNNYILKQGNQVNNNLLHIGFRDNNNFTFAFWYNDINIPVTNYIADSDWHHWSCVYNIANGTRQVYQDGVLVASESGVAPYTGSGTIQIGSFNETSHFFNGGIDDFRIWNVARTANQVNASKNCELQGNEPGLVAYYKFNQGVNLGDNTTQTVAFNATGLNNGTLTNFALTSGTSNWAAGSPVTTGSVIPSAAIVTSPVVYNPGATATPLTATLGANGTGLLWYTTATGGISSSDAPTPSTAVPGLTSYWVSSTNANGCESDRTEILVNILGPATHLNFDGVNDRVELPNEANFDFTATFSLEAWIRVSCFTQEWQTIISKGGEGPRIHRYGGSNFIAFGTGPQADLPSTVSVNDGNWHHIAATCSNGVKRLYVDGVLQGTQVVGTPLVTNNNNVRIGSQIDSYSPVRAFQGDIDEVRFWSIARTATEITASKDCELKGTEPGLVAYYNFNQGVGLANNITETTAFDATGLNNGTLTNFALTGATSNWKAGSPIYALPAAPTVITPVVYNQGDAATSLTATLGANGTALLWYTTATGTSSLSETPTPTTAVSGLTSYWVSSTNANGCEGSRKEIVVNVLPPCATTSTWDGTAWSPASPDSTSEVIFTGDYAGPGFEACSVVVTGTAEVIIDSDETVFIANTITVEPDARFEILNNTNLIQLIGKPNTGNIVVNRNSTPMVHLDYTGWSSPVIGQNLLDFSPQTLTNRFYTYNPAATNSGGAWTSVSNVSSTSFIPATGYMIRAANNASPTVAAAYEGVFFGVPNNGTISTAVQVGTNLVGNPYPSAIDLDEFIENNSPIGVSTLYFWSHAVPQNATYTAQSNYASYTTAGGVAAISGDAQPDGILQIGQGFFMDVATQGSATFSNGQRLGTSNGQFFKNGTTTTEKSRYWLNLKSEVSYFNQMLVAYMDGATNGVDSGIDGKLYSNAPSYLSSQINGEAYVIQGRNVDFDSTEEVPLNFKANSTGIYTIGIDAYDGLFENQAIYLWDKYQNVMHNIKDADYTFTTAAGTFDARFSIVYENETLAIPIFNTQPLLVYMDANDYIQVINHSQLIAEVQIYDLTGRLLYVNKKVAKNKTAVLNTFGNQMVLVKTILENGTINTTKIIK